MHGSLQNNVELAPVISPARSAMIDREIDDGLPGTGKRSRLSIRQSCPGDREIADAYDKPIRISVAYWPLRSAIKFLS